MDRVRGHAFDIHDAVLKGDVERIKALLAEDPDRINTKNPDGAQALLCAVGYQPPKHTPEPVYVRPASPDPAIVKLLLSAGADPNARDMRQRTALHYAAIFNARAIAEALVAGHADVDADGSEHETPLHIATVAGFTNMMSLLLDHAANVDATNHEGATPLLSAVGYESSMTANISYVRPQNTDPAVVKLLLDRGANPNVFGLSRGTPLHYAAQFDLPAIAQLLVGAKADVNARDGRGETPLHRATASGHLAVAELLLASGADPSLADDNRWTPLSTAANRNDQAMVDLLRRHGAK